MDLHFLSGIVKELGNQQVARRAETRKREDAELARRQQMLDHIWSGVMSGTVKPELYAQALKDHQAAQAAMAGPSKKGVRGAFTGEHDLASPFLDLLLSGSDGAEAPAEAGPSAPTTSSQPSFLTPAPLPAPPQAAGVGPAGLQGPSGPFGAANGPATGPETRLRFSAAPEGSGFSNTPFRFIKDLPMEMAAASTAKPVEAPALMGRASAPKVSFAGSPSVPPPPVEAPPAKTGLAAFMIDKAAEARKNDDLAATQAANRTRAMIADAVKRGEITPEQGKAALAHAMGVPDAKAGDWQQTGNVTAAPYDIKTPDGTIVKKGDPVEGVINRATGEMRYVPGAAKVEKPDDVLSKDQQLVALRALGRQVTRMSELTAADAVKMAKDAEQYEGTPQSRAMADLAMAIRQSQMKAENYTPPIVDRFPSPTEALEVDPVLGRTKGAIFEDAFMHAFTGAFPVGARANDAKSRALRNAIDNSSAEMARRAGVTRAELAQDYAASGKTLIDATKRYSAAQGAAAAAAMNLDLVAEHRNDVLRSDSPVVANWQNWLARNVTGDPKLSAYEQYIYTAIREYAKVVTGSSASIAGLGQHETQEINKLLNAAQNPGQVEAQVAAMKNDMASQMAGLESRVAANSKNGAAAKFMQALESDSGYRDPGVIVPVDVAKALKGAREGSGMKGSDGKFYQVKGGVIVPYGG